LTVTPAYFWLSDPDDDAAVVLVAAGAAAVVLVGAAAAAVVLVGAAAAAVVFVGAGAIGVFVGEVPVSHAVSMRESVTRNASKATRLFFILFPPELDYL